MSIAAIIFLPLVLLITSGVLLLGLSLAVEAKATTACRVRMAQGQLNAANALVELTRLNSKARSLEKTRQLALKALKTSIVVPNPGAKAAALAALRTVEAVQAPLRTQQLYWLAKGRYASSMIPFQAKQGILESIPSTLRPWLQAAEIRTQVPRFQLVVSSPTHLTPTYLPAPDFQQSQNGVLKWKNTVQRPSGQNSLEADLLPEIEIGCSMTLEPRGGGRWAPQPTEDKLLSNSSSS